MKIGKVIRKYRKEKHMTQEAMASYLGVSTAAVNKWENDNSYPDITLLSPIARLLNISLDELLSFRENLSEKEVYQYTEELNQIITKKSLIEGYKWSKEKVKEFPSSYLLMLRVAAILDANRLFKEQTLPDEFEQFIQSLYERSLKSTDAQIRLSAADALSAYYSRQKKYKEAEECLQYYSPQNPEKKRKQAQLYYDTGQDEKAFQSYEELLYATYLQSISYFNGLYLLAVRNEQFEKARILADKQSELAKLFEFGRYYEIVPQLELAIMEKNEAETIRIVKEMFQNIDGLFEAKKSLLYEHMIFKNVEPGVVENMRENLKKNLANESNFGFLKDNEEWKRILNLK